MRKLIYGVVFLLIGILFFVENSYSITYVIPWYEITLSIDENALPKGVEVIYEQKQFGITSAAIINKSEIPIYFVLELNDKGQFEATKYYEGSDFPTNINPMYKLVKSKVYRWSLKSKSWEQYSYLSFDKKGYVNIYDLISAWLNKERSSIKMKVTESVSEHSLPKRPKNVEIPKSHIIKVPLYYKGKEMDLNVTVSYKLNPNWPEDESSDKDNPRK